MSKIEIEALVNPSKEDCKIIDDGITQYNIQQIGKQKYIPVGSFARKGDKVIGGITGNMYWNYLFIDLMWIEDEYRGQGIGKQLIDEFEKLSIKHGIYKSHLYTASFQSLDFYKKCGYSVVGQLEDMPEGETEYMLYKRLQT